MKQELKGIAKKGVLEVAKQAGSITNPVAQFSVGALALAGASAVATAKGTSDNKTGQNNTVITNPSLDTKNFLTADEAFKIISTDSQVKNQIAAGLYYKDIGSRKGLTIAESDLEYTGSSSSVKNVYTSKATTDIRKLVTEGYLKINRQTLNVVVATEKAGL